VKSGYDADFYGEIDRTSGPSAARVVPLVLDLAPSRSVVDVGCGDGSWLAAFKSAGVDAILGIDGPWIAPRQLKIPTRDFRRMRLDEPIRLERRFDLAVSLEVAEHLPQARADGFVSDLVALAPVVLFSAAIPGQGGHLHVNEQWPAYWSALFARHGYKPADTLRRRLWSDDGVAWWYRQNLLFFAGEQGLAANPKLAAEAGEAPALVHPQCFQNVRRQAEPGFGRWLRMGARTLRRRKPRA
jgi:SAM-dependent methyltransferase